MSSFMYRPDYAELAKTVHSISGSITTIFLFTRLWARTNRYKGLWWDDYILITAWVFLMLANGLAGASPSYGFSTLPSDGKGLAIQFSGVSCMFVAIALSKTAFATTLLRLSVGKDKVMLWFLMALVNVFNLAMVIATWLNICNVNLVTGHFASLPGRCLTMTTIAWIHAGNAIVSLVADIVLAIWPWRIVCQVDISGNEKWAVAASMSLVGLAAFVTLAKTIIITQLPGHRQGEVDYTYGVVVICCLQQAEAAIFIIAQAIPVLRVLFQGNSPTTSNRNSIQESQKSKKPTGRKALVADTNLELVQLPSGRIVPANSEEGIEHHASEEIQRSEVPAKTQTGGQAAPDHRANDEVHRIWSDMGLSRRAYSQSPEPVRAR